MLLGLICLPTVREGDWRLLECTPAWEGREGEALLGVVNYAPTRRSVMSDSPWTICAVIRSA